MENQSNAVINSNLSKIMYIEEKLHGVVETLCRCDRLNKKYGSKYFKPFKTSEYEMYAHSLCEDSISLHSNIKQVIENS